MVKPVDLKYGIAFGFAGFVITLVGIYYATGMLDLRFPAVYWSRIFWWRISRFSDEKVA